MADKMTEAEWRADALVQHLEQSIVDRRAKEGWERDPRLQGFVREWRRWRSNAGMKGLRVVAGGLVDGGPMPTLPERDGA